MAGDPRVFPFSSDLLAIAEQLDQCEADAATLAGSLTDEQVNWSPAAASWSIAQCLTHLTQTNLIYADAMRESVLAAATKLQKGDRRWERVGPIAPGWAGSWFLRQMEPPARMKMPTPRKLQPAPKATAAAALESYVRSHDAVRALLRESRALNLNRLRFRNPFFPLLRWSVGTGLLIVPAHGRRHLYQMRQIRAFADFPGPANTYTAAVPHAG